MKNSFSWTTNGRCLQRKQPQGTREAAAPAACRSRPASPSGLTGHESSKCTRGVAPSAWDSAPLSSCQTRTSERASAVALALLCGQLKPCAVCSGQTPCPSWPRVDPRGLHGLHVKAKGLTSLASTGGSGQAGPGRGALFFLVVALCCHRSHMGNVGQACQEGQLVARFGKKTTECQPGRLWVELGAGSCSEFQALR